MVDLLGENEEESPWEPLATEMGLEPDANAVSCTLTRTYEFVDNRHTQDVEQLLWDFADTISRTGVMIFRSQSAGIVFSPEHAQMLAGAGFSKTDVKDWLIEHCGRVEADLRSAGKDAVSEGGPGGRSAGCCRSACRVMCSCPFLPSREVGADHRRRRAQRGDVDGVPRVRGVVNRSVDDRAGVRRRWRPSAQRTREAEMYSQEGLDAMRESLAADGYELDAREEGDRLLVTIDATPDACEDCLAPSDVMRSILARTLAVPAEAIELRYPDKLPDS